LPGRLRSSRPGRLRRVRPASLGILGPGAIGGSLALEAKRAVVSSYSIVARC